MAAPKAIRPAPLRAMDATAGYGRQGLDKTHRDAVREMSARVLAQLHQHAKRGRSQRVGRRVGLVG